MLKPRVVRASLQSHWLFRRAADSCTLKPIAQLKFEFTFAEQRDLRQTVWRRSSKVLSQLWIATPYYNSHPRRVTAGMAAIRSE